MFKHTVKSTAVSFGHGVARAALPKGARPYLMKPSSRGRRVLMSFALALLLASTLLTPAIQIVPNLAHAADGIRFDTSFRGVGVAITDFFGGNDRAFDVAIDSQDRIVTAGMATVSATNTDFAIIRFNPDGSFDVSLDGDSKETIDFNGKPDEAFTLAIQPDARIVVAGYETNPDGTTDSALVRLNPNGSLDTSFGTGGKVTTNLGGNDFISRIALQPDGKIVGVGAAQDTANPDFAVARYNPNGSLDATFGVGGIVRTDFSGRIDYATDVISSPDGKLIVVGLADAAGLAGGDFGIAVYNANGSLDTGFGIGGKATLDFFGRVDIASAVILLESKIIVAGQADKGPPTFVDFAAARFNLNGSLDMTFGTGGKVTTDFAGLVDQGFDIVLQPDNKFIVVGSADEPRNGGINIALAQYNPDGSLDTSFGTNGKFTGDANNGSTDLVFSAALVPGGKLAVAGATCRLNGPTAQDFSPNGQTGCDDFMAVRLDGLKEKKKACNAKLEISRLDYNARWGVGREETMEVTLRNNGPDDLDSESIFFSWAQVPRIGTEDALGVVRADKGGVSSKPGEANFSISLSDKLKAGAEVTVKVKVKISEELKEPLTGDPLLLSIGAGGFVFTERGFDLCAGDVLLGTRIDPFDARPIINGAEVIKKALRVLVSQFSFADFDTMEASSIEAQASGPVILLNGEPQKTKPDEVNPTTILVGPKAGKKIQPGETVKIQVQKADGTLSSTFIYTRPQ
jgi:uncharacterized delta-60 repeat protein